MTTSGPRGGAVRVREPLVDIGTSMSWRPIFHGGMSEAMGCLVRSSRSRAPGMRPQLLGSMALTRPLEGGSSPPTSRSVDAVDLCMTPSAHGGTCQQALSLPRGPSASPGRPVQEKSITAGISRRRGGRRRSRGARFRGIGRVGHLGLFFVGIAAFGRRSGRGSARPTPREYFGRMKSGGPGRNGEGERQDFRHAASCVS